MTITLSAGQESWSESATVATRFMPAPWRDRVLALYECDDRDRASAFIQRNPEVTGLLAEAPGHVEDWFGLGTPMTLRVYTHPEEEDAEEIFVLVHFPGSAEEARKKLALFDERWWLDVAAAAGGRLGFNVLFV